MVDLWQYCLKELFKDLEMLALKPRPARSSASFFWGILLLLEVWGSGP